MLKKRISQKSIIEEYKLLEGAGSLFRIRMNENWILRYKDLIQKKIIKKEISSHWLFLLFETTPLLIVLIIVWQML